MSKWYDILLEEHRVILETVDSLKRYSSYLEKGGAPRKQMLDDMLDIIVNFADRCHHGKEEQALFPLVRNKPTRDRTMVDLLLLEHDEAREFVRMMKSAEHDAALRGAHGYTSLLIAHIAKENPYFRECDGLCTEKEREALFRGFERIEEEVMGQGKHEYYHKKAEEIRKAAMGL
jgi:hemerythrin-like domain-containing protein